MISEAFNPSHSRFFGAMLQWCWRAVLWRRRSGIWEESSSGQVKVQWLTLCYSSLRPECWDCDGQQHGIHISQVSPENANYGGNQLQTLQITAPKTWENGDKQSHNGDTIWQNVALNATEEWNWKDKNQKYWNIAWKKYKVKKSWEIRLYKKPPERWPNGRMLVRRLQWNYVWWNFFQVAKTWSPRIDGSNYTPFFQLKNFYGRENDLQSWNPTFLGIRSPNPLPISSGLGNLTRMSQLSASLISTSASSTSIKSDEKENAIEI